MSPKAQLEAFAQSVYLAIKNRYFDDIESEDGAVFLNQVIDWTNQFLDELENELGSDGSPINWNWVRVNGSELGTASVGDSSISAPSGIANLLSEEGRYVQLLVNGTVVSNWSVVSPSDIGNYSGEIVADMCAMVGTDIVFSRAFLPGEDGGTIIGDVTTPLPRMVATTSGDVVSPTNVKALTVVKPKQLLILGVAKNATLPDIVQGGLSPSYVQKYGDLLKNAIARNEASSLAGIAQRDNFSDVSGVGF